MSTTTPTRRRWTDEQLAWMQSLDARRVPRREIARRFTAETGIPLSVHTLHKLLVRPPREPKGDMTKLTVDIARDQAEQVRSVARDLGYVTGYGPNTGAGSIGGLLSAIGAGDVEVKLRKVKRVA